MILLLNTLIGVIKLTQHFVFVVSWVKVLNILAPTTEKKKLSSQHTMVKLLNYVLPVIAFRLYSSAKSLSNMWFCL